MRRSLALLTPTIRAFSLHVHARCDSHPYRGFAARSAQNASVVLNRSIRRAPLSKIRRSKRTECERGVQPIHPTSTPIKDSPLEAPRMRAWRLTEASDEHPYRGFAARSAQNASVVPSRSMWRAPLSRIRRSERPECERGALGNDLTGAKCALCALSHLIMNLVNRRALVYVCFHV